MQAEADPLALCEGPRIRFDLERLDCRVAIPHNANEPLAEVLGYFDGIEGYF
ncbi:MULTISPECIES: hypothetical protein [unclassified Mesorhizobium]|uniref:hypothetical protein n=1 Tax=unclassified Mesorhizobium TaxID=325217 RepID=UPI00167B2990|nr:MULTISPECIES: hypothetical protein [unclassified Mesorhizobium]